MTFSTQPNLFLTFSMTFIGFTLLFSPVAAGSYDAQERATDMWLTSSGLELVGDLTNTIRVPQDQPNIQAGIDAAQDGDLVLVSPGSYLERLTLSGKTITLASEFYTTGDKNFINQTIIDGQGGAVITVDASVGPETKITGFTIQNGDDGISAFAKLNILNNRFIGNNDAIDYEAGGGICRNNVFEDNGDDAIDLDNSIEVTIENNTIQNSGDDGIEIRLHEHISPLLTVIIRNNTIAGSGEDGIQFIGYPAISNRVFFIEYNLIKDSEMVGIGLMDGSNTVEDFRGASLPDRIHVTNNTFVNNDHTITGGDNLIALNNIFEGSATLGLKNVDGSSVAAYNLFWNNTVDYQNSNVLLPNSIFADPLFVDPLSDDFTLQPGSPAINAGTALYVHNGETVLDLQPADFNGYAPDMGAFEWPPTTPGNQAPKVDAGPDQVIALPNSANLDGMISDDGLPSPPMLSSSWSQVSGPGTVTFGDVTAVDTTADFSATGTYVLRLEADDGELTAFNEVTIWVFDTPFYLSYVSYLSNDIRTASPQFSVIR